MEKYKSLKESNTPYYQQVEGSLKMSKKTKRWKFIEKLYRFVSHFLRVIIKLKNRRNRWRTAVRFSSQLTQRRMINTQKRASLSFLIAFMKTIDVEIVVGQRRLQETTGLHSLNHKSTYRKYIYNILSNKLLIFLLITTFTLFKDLKNS